MRSPETPLFSNLITDYRVTGTLNPVADIARKVLPEPVKNQLRQIIRKEKATFPLPNPVNLQINGSEADFWVKNHSDWYRIISQDSERPYAERMLLEISQKQNSVFVDIGAAQGVYSILAAKTGAEVYAFDPDPVSYESFSKNMELNPDINIKYYNFALGDCVGTTTLHADRRGIYAPSLKHTVPGLKDTVETPLYPLDKLVHDNLIPSPEIVKIDVEGAECLVLKGMKNILSSEKKPSDLFIEIHSEYLKKFGSNASNMVGYIKDFGYTEKSVWERRKEYLCHFVRKP